MKRVCTLRKVLFSVSKVLLEKLFFIVLKYCGFYHHSVLIVLISWLFIATQFLSSLKYLQPGDMIWNGNPKYLHEKKFLDFIVTFTTHSLTCCYIVTYGW